MEEINQTDVFEEKVIKVSRISKVSKGGKKLSFNCLTAVGDKNGTIGLGFGKANEVPYAIRKSINNAKKNLFKIPIANDTIPFEVIGKCGAAKVLLKPASQGTGLVAGSAVRAILSVSGIKNILSKSLGSTRAVNLSKATIYALKKLKKMNEVINYRKTQIKKETTDETKSDSQKK